MLCQLFAVTSRAKRAALLKHHRRPPIRIPDVTVTSRAKRAALLKLRLGLRILGRLEGRHKPRETCGPIETSPRSSLATCQTLAPASASLTTAPACYAIAARVAWLAAWTKVPLRNGAQAAAVLARAPGGSTSKRCEPPSPPRLLPAPVPIVGHKRLLTSAMAGRPQPNQRPGPGSFLRSMGLSTYPQATALQGPSPSPTPLLHCRSGSKPTGILAHFRPASAPREMRGFC